MNVWTKWNLLKLKLFKLKRKKKKKVKMVKNKMIKNQIMLIKKMKKKRIPSDQKNNFSIYIILISLTAYYLRNNTLFNNLYI